MYFCNHESTSNLSRRADYRISDWLPPRQVSRRYYDLDDHHRGYTLPTLWIGFLHRYYFEKEKVAKKTTKAEQQEGQQEEENLKSPSFPIAGVGSIALGIILAVMPNTFTTWMVVYPLCTAYPWCCQPVYEPCSLTPVRSCPRVHVGLPYYQYGCCHLTNQ